MSVFAVESYFCDACGRDCSFAEYVDNQCPCEDAT